MSVIEYSFGEIQAIYAAIEGLRSRMQIWTGPERLQHALRAAFCANKAAFACTYGREILIAKCGLPEGCAPKADERQVFKDVGLLLYNCISNGGRDFLPGEDRAALQQVRLDIGRSALDVTERKDAEKRRA
jgi:hypothetical protein